MINQTIKANGDNIEKNRSELDSLGQYYTLLNGKYSSRLCITVHFYEQIHPDMLQRAVDDTVKRIPLLSYRFVKGIIKYYLKLSSQVPKIIYAQSPVELENILVASSDCTFRVIYGDKRITVDTTHNFADGRGLMIITGALLTRYFELLGVDIDKTGVVDCADSPIPEETEDAYIRYGKSDNVNDPIIFKVYHHEGSKPGELTFLKKNFHTDSIKSAAKACGATVTVYILAQIFMAIAAERNSRGEKNPITTRIPIDCRGFFPSRTIRNFTIGRQITMPETDDLPEMIQQLKLQFATINKDYVQSVINVFYKNRNKGWFLPVFIKRAAIKSAWTAEENRYTITYSNLGLFKLPGEIEKRIENLEFDARGFNTGLPIHIPYKFSSITFGNTLSFSIIKSVEGDTIVNDIYKRLEG